MIFSDVGAWLCLSNCSLNLFLMSFEVVSLSLRNQSLLHLSLTVVDFVLQSLTVSVSSGCSVGNSLIKCVRAVPIEGRYPKALAVCLSRSCLAVCSVKPVRMASKGV